MSGRMDVFWDRDFVSAHDPESGKVSIQDMAGGQVRGQVIPDHRGDLWLVLEIPIDPGFDLGLVERAAARIGATLRPPDVAHPWTPGDLA